MAWFTEELGEYTMDELKSSAKAQIEDLINMGKIYPEDVEHVLAFLDYEAPKPAKKAPDKKAKKAKK